MSHTITLETKKYGPVRIQHNSDWSGSVTITWPVQDFPDEGDNLVNIPAELFLLLHREVVTESLRNDLLLFLNNWPKK